jgi:ABC-2 type transport system permease protein
MTATRETITAPRPPFQAVHDCIVITKRNLRKIARSPGLMAASAVQPIVFVLLFRYGFAGAVQTPAGLSYVDYFLPGMLVFATWFGTTTAVALSTDLASGMVDRFRSLPVARSAVLAGRTIADLARHLSVVVLVLAVGSAAGFRFHNGLLGAVGGILVVLAFAFALSWVFALIALHVKDPETAQVTALLPLFPLMFLSGAFVPVHTMPGWLQPFARNQPVSVAITTVRALFEGGPIVHPLWQSAAWFAGILIVCVPLAIARYRQVPQDMKIPGHPRRRRPAGPARAVTPR